MARWFMEDGIWPQCSTLAMALVFLVTLRNVSHAFRKCVALNVYHDSRLSFLPLAWTVRVDV